MSVPPTRPSSTPPSKGGDEGPDDKKTRKKDFNLPGKQEKQEEKKKGLFDIASEVKEMRQEVQQQQAEETKADRTEAISAKEQVTQIGQLIQKMVTQMQVGAVGGKDFARMTLAESRDVPQAFAGSNLTLSYQDNGLIIRFDNFMTPQQQQNALLLIENNKDQLTQMIQSLQAKNIQVAELNIGDRTISLPKIEPLPPPFQPSEPAGAETRGEREGGREGQGEGGGPQE